MEEVIKFFETHHKVIMHSVIFMLSFSIFFLLYTALFCVNYCNMRSFDSWLVHCWEIIFHVATRFTIELCSYILSIFAAWKGVALVLVDAMCCAFCLIWNLTLNCANHLNSCMCDSAQVAPCMKFVVSTLCVQHAFRVSATVAFIDIFPLDKNAEFHFM